MPAARGLDPLLQLEQLDLQQPLVALVISARQALRVGVSLPPGVDDLAVVGPQQRIVVVEVLDSERTPSVLGLQFGELRRQVSHVTRLWKKSGSIWPGVERRATDVPPGAGRCGPVRGDSRPFAAAGLKQRTGRTMVGGQNRVSARCHRRGLLETSCSSRSSTIRLSVLRPGSSSRCWRVRAASNWQPAWPSACRSCSCSSTWFAAGRSNCWRSWTWSHSRRSSASAPSRASPSGSGWRTGSARSPTSRSSWGGRLDAGPDAVHHPVRA